MRPIDADAAKEKIIEAASENSSNRTMLKHLLLRAPWQICLTVKRIFRQSRLNL